MFDDSRSHRNEAESGHGPKQIRRNPLESLSSFVNSLEIKAVGTKISHSASSIRRSMSHRLTDLPQFHAHGSNDENGENGENEDSFENTDNTENDSTLNDSTLNDDDWLASPSSKSKSGLLHSFSQNNSQSSPKRSFQNGANGSQNKENDGQNVFNGGNHEGLYSHDHLTSNEHLPHTSIKTFSVAQDNLPRIDEFELFKILQGQYAGQFDDFVVVDCRFPYEYEGGHISRAVNISSPQQLEEQFLKNFLGGSVEGMEGSPKKSSKNQLLVFHCEYSLLRGPTLASHLRKVDRQINAHRYPFLQYPDIVVLERGYKGFFDKFRHLCSPQAYVAMKDDNFKRTCEIEMSKVMQTSKLTRAKSFNQFPPRLNLAHSRSTSLTALLTNPDFSANTAPLSRSRRSLKIKKRDRKDSRPNFTQSLSSFQNVSGLQNSCESPSDSPVYSRFEHDDFVPPTALFRHNSRSSYSGSLVSVDSSSSSVCSESLSPTFSSSESLVESMSPFNDRSDFYGSLYEGSSITETAPSTENSSELSAHTSYRGLGFNVSHDISVRGAASAINPSKSVRPSLSSLARPNMRPSFRQETSSPTFSSPLKANSTPAYNSPGHNTSSGYEPPYEEPADFFLPPRGFQSGRISRMASRSQSSNLSNLDDVGE